MSPERHTATSWSMSSSISSDDGLSNDDGLPDDDRLPDDKSVSDDVEFVSDVADPSDPVIGSSWLDRLPVSLPDSTSVEWTLLLKCSGLTLPFGVKGTQILHARLQLCIHDHKRLLIATWLWLYVFHPLFLGFAE